MSGIAERLKQARKTLNLTQAELAKKAKVSQGTIGNIEAGLRDRPRELLAIAAALNVDPCWLETGKKQDKQYDVVLTCIKEQLPEPDLMLSLKRVSSALQQSDELTLDQVRPLLVRLIDTPIRAPEIVPRLHELLA